MGPTATSPQFQPPDARPRARDNLGRQRCPSSPTPCSAATAPVSKKSPAATFEAIPQSIVRDEVLKHADGAALSAAASASKALRVASGDAGRAQFQRRFSWLWPSASKPDGPRPRNAAPAGALRLLEEDGSFVLACGTRGGSGPDGGRGRRATHPTSTDRGDGATAP